MSPRKPLRTVFVAVSAAAALTVAPALLTSSLAVPAAYAAPSEYPLGGEKGSTDEGESENGPAERAEKAGGGILSETIDLSADLLKCGLSIATPAVSCPLGS
ncbi:hypothetical protein [Nocardia carnea]|uniref:hypothetical protein n=1 Tax=Nocardia carnea TaxID=37328 RepID=UPI0024574238|nr:hypothetical protein [Nocardia carnea]